jgi:hypothetical protein
MMREWWIGKDLEGSGRGILLGGLRKTTKPVSLDSRSLGRDWNLYFGFPGFKSRPGDKLSWLIFLSPSERMLGQLGNHHFLSNPFQSMIPITTVLLDAIITIVTQTEPQNKLQTAVQTTALE